MLTESVDCPLCAGRDVAAVDGGLFFCPWCMYEWDADAALVMDDATDKGAFLTGLTEAFNQAA